VSTSLKLILESFSKVFLGSIISMYYLVLEQKSVREKIRSQRFYASLTLSPSLSLPLPLSVCLALSCTYSNAHPHPLLPTYSHSNHGQTLANRTKPG